MNNLRYIFQSLLNDITYFSNSTTWAAWVPCQPQSTPIAAKPNTIVPTNRPLTTRSTKTSRHWLATPERAYLKTANQRWEDTPNRWLHLRRLPFARQPGQVGKEHEARVNLAFQTTVHTTNPHVANLFVRSLLMKILAAGFIYFLK